MLKIALRSLPLVVALALRLGAGKVAADAIRVAVKRVRTHLASTKTPVDDIVFAPLLRLALDLAVEIEDGRDDGVVGRLRDLVELILKALASRA